MTKLKIRITQLEPVVKQRRWFFGKELLETTVFLHEFDGKDFFEILEAIGKIVNSGKKGSPLSEEEIRKIREIENIGIEDRPIEPSPKESSDDIPF